MRNGSRCPGWKCLVPAVLLLLALPAWAATEGRCGWEPDRTWVFAAGVLEWKDPQAFGPFPQEERRDAELVELFRSAGVPAEQIVYLRDAEATLGAIEERLAEVLSRTREGDLLVLYYCGHGYTDERGAVHFASYDALTGGVPGWAVAAIFDAVERRFRGSGVLLTADCCHSGALAEETRRRAGGRISYAALASSQAGELSTERWTFTECLLDGLHGRAHVDGNGDGRVALGELARNCTDDMAFAEGQMAAFATTGAFAQDCEMARAAPRSGGRAGERVEAEWQGRWWKARVLETDGERVRVHYVGWPNRWDEWVGPDRLRPFRPVEFAAGEKPDSSDEWVPPHRIRKPSR